MRMGKAYRAAVAQPETQAEPVSLAADLNRDVAGSGRPSRLLPLHCEERGTCEYQASGGIHAGDPRFPPATVATPWRQPGPRSCWATPFGVPTTAHAGPAGLPGLRLRGDAQGRALFLP
jgi:hypothetical protein